jgi:hypothetical protein
MMTEFEYSHGTMNGSGRPGMPEAVAVERRFTLIEAGLTDHSRRLASLETGFRESEAADHRRDRTFDKMEASFAGLMEAFESLRGRFGSIEAENKRIMIGSLMGALGIIYQILKPKLGL